MKDSDIKGAFAKLKVNKRDGEEKPHKPLLVLYMLGRCWHCRERMVSIREAAGPFGELLARFGLRKPSNAAIRYPFWALYNDTSGKEHLWDLFSPQLAEKDKGVTKVRPLFSEMVRGNYNGGFSKDLHRRIVHDKFLLLQIAFIVMDKAFPKHLHAELLEAVGIPDYETGAHRAFRSEVLRSYRNSCAVCSYSGQIGDQHIGVHVAHIKWPNAGGPDQCDNALALCSQHRELFDAGAFTLSEQTEISVSSLFAESSPAPILHSLAGKRIYKPTSLLHRPNDRYVNWHRKNVYLRP